MSFLIHFNYINPKTHANSPIDKAKNIQESESADKQYISPNKNKGIWNKKSYNKKCNKKETTNA